MGSSSNFFYEIKFGPPHTPLRPHLFPGTLRRRSPNELPDNPHGSPPLIKADPLRLLATNNLIRPEPWRSPGKGILPGKGRSRLNIGVNNKPQI